jgi:hypothetical protein
MMSATLIERCCAENGNPGAKFFFVATARQRAADVSAISGFRVLQRHGVS